MRSCRGSGLAKHVVGGPGRSVWMMGVIELQYGEELFRLCGVSVT